MSSPRATPNITGPPVVIPLSFLPNAERTHIVSVWLKRCASLPISRLPDCVRPPIVLHSINNVRILIENYFKNVIDQNKRDRRVFIFCLFHCIYYLIYERAGGAAGVGRKISQLRWPLSLKCRPFSVAMPGFVRFQNTPKIPIPPSNETNQIEETGPDITAIPDRLYFAGKRSCCLSASLSIVERYTINQMKALYSSASDANGTDSFPAMFSVLPFETN